MCNFVDNVDNRNPTGPGEEWKRMDQTAEHRWFTCEEHVEWVLDDFVEEFRAAPSIDTVSPPGSARCRMCGRPADKSLFLEPEGD